MNMMNMLISNEVGVWIECCNPDCKKWRYSLDFDDPLMVPEKWYCHMNSDRSINSCSAPEYLELDEDEIFVESKFKAGCIVWAKVTGYPWSPAMVDFCPEYETYYWFDKGNTNVPNQYHVTFLYGRKITRAWIKSAWIKSFVKNEDPSFALKSRVRHKKLTAQQQSDIIEGCEIAQAALRLTISRRLKTYNYNSWRLAQRFQNRSTNYVKNPPLSPAASQSSKQAFNTGAGPNSMNKLPTVKKIVTKKLGVKNQSSNKLSTNIKKPAPLSTKRPRNKTPGNGLMRVNTELRSSSRQTKTALTVSENDKNLLNDTSLSVNTSSTVSIERKNDTADSEETRSINSYDSIEIANASFNRERFIAAKKQIIELKLDGDPMVNLYQEEFGEIVDGDLVEIIPNSQPSTPKKTSFKMTDRKHCAKANNIRNEKQPMKQTAAEMGTEEFDSVLEGPNKSRLDSMSSLDSKLKLMMKERGRLNVTEPKSTSENLLRTENKENEAIESRYRRALSEFTSKDPNPLFNATKCVQPRKITPHKPFPDWFSNPEKRKLVTAKRLSRLSKLFDKEENRMYKENRDSFIIEMESADKPGPSKEKNKLDLKPPSYFMNTQNYEHLMTSDEDSL